MVMIASQNYPPDPGGQTYRVPPQPPGVVDAVDVSMFRLAVGCSNSGADGTIKTK